MNRSYTVFYIFFLSIVGGFVSAWLMRAPKEYSKNEIEAHIAAQLKVMSLKVEDLDIGGEHENEGYFVHSIMPIAETALLRMDVIRKADHALFMAIACRDARIKVGDPIKIKMIVIRPTATAIPARIYTLDPRELQSRP